MAFPIEMTCVVRDLQKRASSGETAQTIQSMERHKIDKTMSELTMDWCFALFVSTFITFICLSNATFYCPLRETATTKLDARNKNYYECPGHLPKHYTECCNDNRCCPSLTTSIYEIDQK